MLRLFSQDLLKTRYSILYCVEYKPYFMIAHTYTPYSITNIYQSIQIFVQLVWLRFTSLEAIAFQLLELYPSAPSHFPLPPRPLYPSPSHIRLPYEIWFFFFLLFLFLQSRKCSIHSFFRPFLNLTIPFMYWLIWFDKKRIHSNMQSFRPIRIWLRKERKQKTDV